MTADFLVVCRISNEAKDGVKDVPKWYEQGVRLPFKPDPGLILDEWGVEVRVCEPVRWNGKKHTFYISIEPVVDPSATAFHRRELAQGIIRKGEFKPVAT